MAVLCGAGVIFIRSATMGSGDSTVNKQIAGIVIGAVAMLVLALVDYHFILKICPVIYLVCIALLAALFIPGLGASNYDAVRWLDLQIFTLQPSEFAKIGLIVVLAAYFYNFEEKINSLPVILGSVALFGGMAFLIIEEPDLSTTLVMTFIFIIMIYVAKISYKWILGVLAACVPVGGVVVYIMLQEDQTIFPAYWVNRINAWLFTDQVSTDLTQQSSYSVQAIASGQMYGKGLFNTTLESVKNGNFLSEEDCDFIFAIIGEETGFVGSVIIVALLLLLVVECVWLAVRARDLAGRLICVGVAGLIAFQSFVNIGVATGMLPNTGLPLPFISAGLSSLISLMMGMGLVLNVGLQRKREIT